MSFLTIEKFDPYRGKFLRRLVLTIFLLVVPMILLAAWVLLDLSESFKLVEITQAADGINNQINYQGKIADSSGSSVADGNYNFMFELYDAASGGTLLWEEIWSATSTNNQVVVTGGIFSVDLGTTTPISASLFANDNLYLQIRFDHDNNGTYTEIFAPRKRLTSSPYSFNTDTVDGLHASSTAVAGQLLALDANAGMSLNSVTTSDSLYVGGKLRVATSTAYGTALSVEGGMLVGNTTGAGTTPLIGDGYYHMFLPNKGGALRIGYHANGKWSDANIGNASIVLGTNSKASGSGSAVIAPYASSTAAGTGAMVIGANSYAGGNYSLVMGGRMYTSASAVNTFVYGTSSVDTIIHTPNAAIFYNSNGLKFGVNTTTPGGWYNETLTVDGNALFAGSATTTSYVTIGTAPAGAGYASGDLNVGNNLVVGGYASTTGGLYTSGDANIGTDLYVEGVVTSTSGIYAPFTYLVDDTNPRILFADTNYANTSYIQRNMTTHNLEFRDANHYDFNAPIRAVNINATSTNFDYATSSSMYASHGIGLSGDYINSWSDLVAYIQEAAWYSTSTDKVGNDLTGSNWLTPTTSNAFVYLPEGLYADGRVTTTAEIIATGTFGSGSTPISGAGTRMMWLPHKAAFRAGRVNNDSWDESNIGDYSVAHGFNSRAKGNYSAIGGGNTNVTNYDYAFIGGGSGNSVTGIYGTVGGGTSNQAGAYSFVGGGSGNTASATSTIGGGNSNTASGNYSVIGGGYDNVASGNYSIIPGGYVNQATADYSVAIGSSLINNGEYSLLAGNQTTLDSSADYSFVWSYTNTPITVSEANAFIAYNYNGLSIGLGTTTPNSNSNYRGIFRIATSTNGDIFIVDNNGRVGINTYNPTGQLHVVSDANGPTPVVISETSGANRLAMTVNNVDSGQDVGIALQNQGTTKWEIYNDADNGHRLIFADDGGNDVMTLTQGNNIGIGTTSPTARLSIFDSGASGTDDLLIVGTSTSLSDDADTPGVAFKVEADGNAYALGSFTGGGADYAEYFYSADTDLVAGEAVCVDILRNNAVRRCQTDGDTNIMGIISTRPAFLGNSNSKTQNNPNYQIVAMLGQIPAKVTNENGNIRPGDSLSAASKPGYIKKANPGESTVGIALESTDNTTDTIQVMISRKNKSLTVEEIEQQVTDRIARMEIEDEVQLLVNQTIQDYDLDTQVLSFIHPVQAQIDSLDNLVYQNALKIDNLQNQTDYALIASSTQDLTNKVAVLEQQVTDHANQLNSLQTQISSLEDQASSTQAILTQLLNTEQNIAVLNQPNLNLDTLEVKLAATFLGTLTVQAETTFAKQVIFEDHITLDQDAAGVSTIPANATSTQVVFDQEYAWQPIIVVTPRNNPQGREYIVVKERTTGFSIEIDQPLATELTFNWQAVAVSGYTGTVLGVDESMEETIIMQPVIEPEPVMTPEPAETPEPQPEPVPEPTSEPAVEEAVEPEPVMTPEPAETPEPQPEPVPEPMPEPALTPVPEPVVPPTPAPEPAI